jgi:hypothetical protein
MKKFSQENKTSADGGTRLFFGLAVLRVDVSSSSNSMRRALSYSISLFLAVSDGANSGDTGGGVQLALHVADEIVGGASGPHGQYLHLCRLCQSNGHFCHVRYYLDLNAVSSIERVGMSALRQKQTLL